MLALTRPTLVFVQSLLIGYLSFPQVGRGQDTEKSAAFYRGAGDDEKT